MNSVQTSPSALTPSIALQFIAVNKKAWINFTTPSALCPTTLPSFLGPMNQYVLCIPSCLPSLTISFSQDVPSQANMTPQEAVAAWKAHMEPCSFPTQCPFFTSSDSSLQSRTKELVWLIAGNLESYSNML